MQKLTKRDIRAIQIGVVCALTIAVYIFGPRLHSNWSQAKRSLALLNSKLDIIDVEKGVEKGSEGGLKSIVPVFETPTDEQTQMFAFRKKFFEQLKRAGINSKVLQFLPASKWKLGTYRLLALQCSATCNFGQVMELLASLNENPYMVGVEEFKIKCNEKNPQEMVMDLTVSTLIK